ncbi:Co2+/Mg2+ efflux protein ApaG [Aquabacterium sp.]|jgi:ApaG protein|uniref:Co2+/Mg2+ efflux protein ApaG n=1 Tax=Aquabacterium sp. TaxID=1872578 RepID=UPI0025BA9591|nr:Co2+/Mg2+ efflux protein ApaG [Aquabacterium sp.]
MSQAELSCTVVPQYLEDQSNPARNEYAFAYTVSIVNTGAITAQVVARQWLITDATGRTQEVRGLALVGHQPVLKPGEKFEYTSWTSLDTPHGLMQGTFFCMTEDAHHFEAPIEPFTLARSQSLH